MAKVTARQVQKNIFEAFRKAYETGRHARYLQGIYCEYDMLEGKKSVKARQFRKFVEQAKRIYKNRRNFTVAARVSGVTRVARIARVSKA